MTHFLAAILDLDGVLADTAQLHWAAWQALAREEGFTLPPETEMHLKGVDRMASLNIVLQAATRAYTDAEKQTLAERKNRHYQALIGQLSRVDLLPGAERLLSQLRRRGIPLALASASKNARAVIAGLGIDDCFDYIADAARVPAPKPAPDIFLMAARGLKMAPSDCVGVEDAPAGITALKRAGIHAVGVGDPVLLPDADRVVRRLTDFPVEHYFGRETG